MPVNNSTALVSGFRTGTGWTIDVTLCNLSASLAEKDFDPYTNGGINLLSNWTKTSQVLLTYTGVSLAASTPISIVRRTPIVRVQELVYGSRLNTANYEGELNSLHKMMFDRSIQPPVLLSPSLIDYLTYVRATWVANVLQAPTARAVVAAIDSAIASAAAPTSLAVSTFLTVGTTGAFAGALSTASTFQVGSTSQFAGTVNITTGNLVIGAGNLSVTGTGTFSGAVGTGALTVTGTLGTSGLATLNTLASGNTAITGTLSTSALATLHSATVTNTTTLNGATNTLTTAPNQITAGGTQMVNADWVRRSIRPYIRAVAAGSQSVPHNTNTVTLFATETYDTDGNFASGIFTVPAGAGGLYLVETMVEFTVAVQNIAIQLLINGGNTRFSAPLAAATDVHFRVETCRKVYLAAADTLSVQIYQANSASAARTVAAVSMIDINRLGNI